MENKTFAEIAGLVYKHNRTIVFGIEIRTNGKTIVRLNPNEFKISNIDENNIHVYVIQEDGSIAEEVETLGMTKDEKNKYLNKKAADDRRFKEDEDMDDENIIGNSQSA